MKNLLITLCLSALSVNALANTDLNACYQSSVQVDYAMTPSKVCISELTADLKLFAKSYLKLVINGKKVTTPIIKGEAISPNTYKITANILSHQQSLGACDEMGGFDISLQVLVNSQGRVLSIEKFSGKAYYTDDICHSPTVIDDLEFSRI